MRLAPASLGGKISAASCYLYFLTRPYGTADGLGLTGKILAWAGGLSSGKGGKGAEFCQFNREAACKSVHPLLM
jgi:hypothetical protein